MKIGILTYHFGTNFGGQLQCYALMKTLESLGHEVTVINYIPGNNNASLMNDIKQSLRIIKRNISAENIITGLTSIFMSKRMRNSFDEFRNKHLNVGPLCNLENFNQLYKLDAIVVGSDQVWAPAHHNSAAYFFNFKNGFNGRKISYAPCCAINKVESMYKERISSLLSSFDSISARNIETRNFVKDLTGKEAPIVSDPTFLHKFDEFTSQHTPKGNYILTYILGEEIDGGHKAIIEKIKKEYGNMPVYSISLTASKPHFYFWSDKTYYTLDPVDWVDFIRNAKFLYTDSFHGVAFALKFKTPFLAYYKEVIRASRFIDLMERYKLTNIINKVSDLEEQKLKALQPNEETYKISESIKNKSFEYIKEALS